MEIGELGNQLAADVLKFWMDGISRTLVNHQVKILSAMTFTITAFILKTLSIIGFVVTINNKQHSACYHKCFIFFIVKQSVIVLNVMAPNSLLTLELENSLVYFKILT